MRSRKTQTNEISWQRRTIHVQRWGGGWAWFVVVSSTIFKKTMIRKRPIGLINLYNRNWGPNFARRESTNQPTSIVAISTFATATAAAGSSLVRIDYPLSSSSLHSILTVSSNLCVVWFHFFSVLFCATNLLANQASSFFFFYFLVLNCGGIIA